MKTSTNGSRTPLRTCDSMATRMRGKARDGNDDRAGKQQAGVEPVERGSFAESLVQSRLEAEGLAGRVGGGEWQDQGGKQGGVQ